MPDLSILDDRGDGSRNLGALVRDHEYDDQYAPPRLRGGSWRGVVRNPAEWLFLMENRLWLAGGLLVALFGGCLGIQAYGGVYDQDASSLLYLFSALISGVIALVTIVVAINQLVLSRQLGTPDELREEIEGTVEFRCRAEESIGERIMPVLPSRFYLLLLKSNSERIREITGGLREVPVPEAAREGFVDVLEPLRDDLDRISYLLERSSLGVFSALSVSLETNYADRIYRLRETEMRYRDDLPEEVHDAVDDVVDRLQHLDIARQYFKTLYLQHELSKLSRLLIVVGIPAVLAPVAMLLLFASSQDPVFAPVTLMVVVSAMVTVALSPLAILVSYVLRLATVTQRTAAITPFTTPEQEARSFDVEVDRDRTGDDLREKLEPDTGQPATLEVDHDD